MADLLRGREVRARREERLRALERAHRRREPDRAQPLRDEREQRAVRLAQLRCNAQTFLLLLQPPAIARRRVHAPLERNGLPVLALRNCGLHLALQLCQPERALVQQQREPGAVAHRSGLRISELVCV
jgi:hypothetical protein